MTILATIQQRNELNIDTHEKALVYAALLLRKANASLSDYKKAVRIASSGDFPTKILIEATIPYDSINALGMGGNFAENVKVFSNNDPNPLKVSLESNNTSLGQDPLYVDSLEKYFVFHCLQWQQALMMINADILYFSKIQFLEEAPVEPSLKITLSIPYDYGSYLVNRNLIQSLSFCGHVIEFLELGLNLTILSSIEVGSTLLIEKGEDNQIQGQIVILGSLSQDSPYQEFIIVSFLSFSGTIAIFDETIKNEIILNGELVRTDAWLPLLIESTITLSATLEIETESHNQTDSGYYIDSHFMQD